MTSCITQARAGEPFADPAASTRVYHALAASFARASRLAVQDQAWRSVLDQAPGRAGAHAREFPASATEDILRRLLPTLSTCVNTLTALEASSPSPVHGSEAPRLLRALSSALSTSFGLRLEEAQVRPALYALMRSLSCACSAEQSRASRVRVFGPAR